jgi:hypothetical protein
MASKDSSLACPQAESRPQEPLRVTKWVSRRAEPLLPLRWPEFTRRFWDIPLFRRVQDPATIPFARTQCQSVAGSLRPERRQGATKAAIECCISLDSFRDSLYNTGSIAISQIPSRPASLQRWGEERARHGPSSGLSSGGPCLFGPPSFHTLETTPNPSPRACPGFSLSAFCSLRLSPCPAAGSGLPVGYDIGPGPARERERNDAAPNAPNARLTSDGRDKFRLLLRRRFLTCSDSVLCVLSVSPGPQGPHVRNRRSR